MTPGLMCVAFSLLPLSSPLLGFVLGAWDPLRSGNEVTSYFRECIVSGEQRLVMHLLC
jgi:hypothetical protein